MSAASEAMVVNGNSAELPQVHSRHVALSGATAICNFCADYRTFASSFLTTNHEYNRCLGYE